MGIDEINVESCPLVREESKDNIGRCAAIWIQLVHIGVHASTAPPRSAVSTGTIFGAWPIRVASGIEYQDAG